MKTKYVSMVLVTLALFGLFVMTLLPGCSTSSNDDDATSTLSIVMNATPLSVSVDSTSLIEARLVDGIEGVAERVIIFDIESGSGQLNPAIDTTDADGYVATLLVGSQPGTIVVSAAYSDDITANLSVAITSSGSGDTTGTDTTTTGSGNVDLAVTPKLLEADGHSLADVTVTVLDGSGEPAPAGTRVNLAAGEHFDDINGDGYFTAGVDQVLYDANDNGAWDAIGQVPDFVAVAGTEGAATFQYTAGTTPAAVYIRATVDDTVISGYAETTVQLTAGSEIASITLVADSIHLKVAGTGGYEHAMLYATGYDDFGNRVPANVPIYFAIIDGPGGGEHLADVGYGPYIAVTNSNGVAACPIAAGTVSGSIRIRAYSGLVMSQATQILVHAGPPHRIVVASEECNVRYWGWVNKTVEVTALVSDVYNNPCPDSTVVYFTCDEGVIKAHETRIQEENGLAGTVWMSYGADSTADGDVWIYAETNGGDLVDSGMFINSWIPDTLWFVTWPENLNANGYSDGFMYVEVRDLNMNYVINLDEIQFESDFVEYENREDGDGCFTSGISNYAKAVILDQDYSLTGSQDDGIGAVDNLVARYGVLASQAVPCTLRTGAAYRDNCDLNVENTTGDYNETIYFSVTINDRWGNPLGDHMLVATADNGGVIPSGSRRTDQYGKVEEYAVTLPAASSGAEKVNITVQDIDPRGGITLTEQITIPTNPTLAVMPLSLDFGAVQTSLNLTIMNSGTGTISWTIVGDQAWLDTDDSSGTTIDETDQVQVTVDRSGLAAGDYTGTINVNSDAGNAVISVEMTVP